MNYFDFYGLPVKFNLNVQGLKAKYLAYLKLNHPDFFVNDASKYQDALDKTSLNNEAYLCLANDSLRANYILKLSGYEFDEKLPSDFLMEMMELNEMLEDVKYTASVEQIKALETNILGYIDTLSSEFSKLCTEADTANKDHKLLLSTIKVNLLKNKYLLRLKETLANIAPQ